MTPTALANGFSLNFNLLSQDETAMPPTYKAVACNVMLPVPVPPINHLKLESLLLYICLPLQSLLGTAKSISCILLEQMSIPPAEVVSMPKYTPTTVGAIDLPLAPVRDPIAPKYCHLPGLLSMTRYLCHWVFRVLLIRFRSLSCCHSLILQIGDSNYLRRFAFQLRSRRLNFENGAHTKNHCRNNTPPGWASM